jgi:futalosine hydrolase
MDPIVLICAAPLEAKPMLERLAVIERLSVTRREAYRGRLQGLPVVLLVGGMGKTNAAHALTALLERERVRGVLGFGVAGAYAGSALKVGEIALATSEHYGDEGVETPRGWISCEGIGIPLATRAGADLFNDFPVDRPGLDRATEVLADAGIHYVSGPFVTVSSCSGTAARGDVLAARFGAICESMEGAAYAHVALLYDLPFLEVRGVSNPVEDRDLSRWRLDAGAEAAAEAAHRVACAWMRDPIPEAALGA